ncbi:MFS transporter [Rhodococcus sp. 27YEA15]|uniref:MFS transporter n=1 Tax=Rhodococcus sp. 27YEA15 TaxID=3156259 RepID=UPI003C7A7D32
MVGVLIMAAAAFGGWSLLLPVVPLQLARSGGSDALAGSVTAVFMAATVLTQLLVPRLLRTYGYRAVLVAGCLLLGPPSLVLLLSADAVAVLAVSAVRGVGFGMLTVAGSALVAELAPAQVLGRATGAQGIAIASSQMAGLPLGLAIAERWSTAPVFVLGALVPALAVVAIARLPRLFARPTGTSVRLSVVVVLVPVVALACVAAVFGGLTSLLPIAIADRAAVAGVVLAVASVSILVGRFGAGLIADRFGAGRMLVPALVSAAAGSVLFTLAVDDGATVVLLCAAVLFGLGFGAVQNESLVMAFRAAGPSRLGSASAVWNISFDAGTGIGALALGFVAAAAGYPWVFAVSALAVALIPALAAGGKVMGARVGR